MDSRIGDVPVGYAPPVGPTVNFIVTYNQHDVFLNRTGNLGGRLM